MTTPRFNLRDLFLAVLLIALGCTGLNVLCWDSAPQSPLAALGGGLMLFTSPIWIGAGIGTPLHQPWRGALYGLAAAIGFAIVGMFSLGGAVRE